MRILILGAGGFIGRRLARVLQHATPAATGVPPASAIVLADVTPPPGPLAPNVTWHTGDVRDAAFVEPLFAQPYDRIFHLAALLTLQAEAEYRRALETNVLALVHVLDLCRRQAIPPRLVFPSSISAFGGALPDTVDDDVPRTPQTSYGTHKAIAELLIADASRRGFVDGRALRLPVVLTHPGPASGSVSDRIAALIREPLSGREATCPLAPDTRMPVASVGAVVRALLALAQVPASALPPTRTMNLPSLTVTPSDLVAAVERRAPALGVHPQWRWEPDARMQAIVDDWPRTFTSARALELGIRGDADIDAVVDDYLVHRDTRH